jgi:hypothetical protein
MRRIPILLTVPLVLVAGCGASNKTAGGGSPGVSAATSSSPTTGGGSAVAASPPLSPGGVGPTAIAAEKNPPGDIPDNVAYVPYTNSAGKYSFTHPEGWAETTRSGSVTFTDKLNGVQAHPGTLITAPTVDSAKQQDVPALTRSQAAFELRGVTAVTEPGGRGVRIVYRRNSAPDPVTGRQYRDEVERYELVSHGREIVVELYGPVGSDNVDAYKMMITSLKIT